LKSRADSTVKKYLNEVVSFFKFMEKEKLSVSMPASVGHIALYLSFLLRKRKTSAVSLAHSALKWVHRFLPTQHNPADTVLCRNLVEAEKWQRLAPIKKRQPASVELINQMTRTFAHETATIKDLRSATMFAVCFAGLFRAKELLSITVCDIHFGNEHARIHLG
jgi:site-specific recombinase XerD